MEEAKLHPNESARLESLHFLNILDTLPEKDFDNITFLASQICETPIALISLVDQKRQWFKAKVGLKASETERSIAFCAHAILQDDVFLVKDSSKDKRFFDNPLVTGDTNVQFYAGAPLLSPDGNPIGTLCVIDDKVRDLSLTQIESLKALSNQVTRLLELKVKIRELEASKQSMLFKLTALNNISEGVVIQDSDGKIVDFNPAALKTLELTPDEIAEKPSFFSTWSAIHENGKPFQISEHPFVVCLKTGRPQNNTIMGIQASNLAHRWLSVSSVPLSKDNQPPTHTVTSFADITNQVEVKKLIAQEKETLQFVLDSLPLMVGYWNKDMTNISTNKSFETHLGITPTIKEKKHIRDILGNEHYSKNIHLLNEMLTGKKVTYEREMKLDGDSTSHLLGFYIPNQTNGETESFLTVEIDITEQKKLEKLRHELELKLIESSRLSILGEMSAGIAHEINNPLAIIIGRIEVTRMIMQDEKSLSPEIDKQLIGISKTIERIAKIIKGLRAFARDASNDDYKIILSDEIINQTLDLCSQKLKEAQIELKLNIDKTIQIECNGIQISQILINLIGNSYDAIQDQESKWIEINVQEKEDFAEFIVTDSGNGINPSFVEKIMNPFFTTKEVGKGTGLGLSIASGLASSHGGDLKYDRSCKNTRFVLRIPKNK